MHVTSEGYDVLTCHMPTSVSFEFARKDRYVIGLALFTLFSDTERKKERERERERGREREREKER